MYRARENYPTGTDTLVFKMQAKDLSEHASNMKVFLCKKTTTQTNAEKYAAQGYIEKPLTGYLTEKDTLRMERVKRETFTKVRRPKTKEQRENELRNMKKIE